MIVVPILAGVILLALARGGRITNLAFISIRWPALIFAGFFIQVLIFTPPWQERETLRAYTQLAYVISLIFLWAALGLNWHLPGMSVIAFGFSLNLAAVVLNAGYMPSSALAMEMAGLPPLGPGEIMNNSVGIGDMTVLPFLGDIFSVPSLLPFANVFSIGDILIALGAVYLVYKVIRAPAPART